MIVKNWFVSHTEKLVPNRKFDSSRMACMNVFFALVVQHHVQVTGGMPINISDQLFSCKLTSP